MTNQNPIGILRAVCGRYRFDILEHLQSGEKYFGEVRDFISESDGPKVAASTISNCLDDLVMMSLAGRTFDRKNSPYVTTSFGTVVYGIIMEAKEKISTSEQEYRRQRFIEDLNGSEVLMASILEAIPETQRKEFLEKYL